MEHEPLRVLIIGAHPDDADIKAGGSAAKWRALGHTVTLVSLTDGRHGHHVDWGDRLAQRRQAEARAAGAVIGAEYLVGSFPDGELQPSLQARQEVIRLIRRHRPDVVITHRPSDYHPDHRYTSQLVQDAAYLITVPGLCPDTPFLPENPVILYFSDTFREPTPFRPDVVVDISVEFDTLVTMLDCHVSQFYEWLPFNAGHAAEVPQSPTHRKAWLADRLRDRLRPLADDFRDQLRSTYGPDLGAQIEFIEAFAVSEVGSPLDATARARLFPFLPAPTTPTAPPTPPRRSTWVDQRPSK